MIVGNYEKYSVFEKVKHEAKRCGVPVITVPCSGVSTMVNAMKSRFGFQTKTEVGVLA